MSSITLITPVWNNADTLADCMQSIQRQTKSCQHIIIDGASTDGTIDVINEYRTADTVVVSEPDAGMYDAINKGLALASNDIVGILNADDFYSSDNALASVTEVFSNPLIEASYSDLVYVERNNTNKVTRHWMSGNYDRAQFLWGWMPPHPTFFLRRALYNTHGGYRLDLGSAADYELMLRMLYKHRATAHYLPGVLVRMRNEGMSNASLRSRIKANRHDRNAWRVNDLTPRPWTLMAKPARKLGQWLPGFSRSNKP